MCILDVYETSPFWLPVVLADSREFEGPNLVDFEACRIPYLVYFFLEEQLWL